MAKTFFGKIFYRLTRVETIFSDNLRKIFKVILGPNQARLFQDRLSSVMLHYLSKKR
jgi:hypothetical protein